MRLWSALDSYLRIFVGLPLLSKLQIQSILQGQGRLLSGRWASSRGHINSEPCEMNFRHRFENVILMRMSHVTFRPCMTTTCATSFLKGLCVFLAPFHSTVAPSFCLALVGRSATIWTIPECHLPPHHHHRHSALPVSS